MSCGILVLSHVWSSFKNVVGVTKEKLNGFFDGSNNLLCNPKLLREFLQQDHTYGSQYFVDILNLLKSTLDACKDMDTVDNFQTMVLKWDTGA